MGDSNTFSQQTPSMNTFNGSHNAEPLNEISHLKQMFKESHARMARMQQDNEGPSYGYCASEASKMYGGAGISRTGSGSTSASGARYSQSEMSDSSSDVDDFPLGA